MRNLKVTSEIQQQKKSLLKLKGDENMADYPLLYGHSSNGCRELKGIEEVAEYIVKEGLQSDLMITTPMDLPLITTFGPFSI